MLQLVLGWGLVSCLSPVAVDIQSTGKRIVITGQVSTLVGRTFAQIGESAGPEKIPVGLSDAWVQLVDENDDTYSFIETIGTRITGRYTLPGFSATPGVLYFIRVTTPTGVFESTPERVPMQTGSDKLSYEFSKKTVVDLDGVPFTNDMVQVFTEPSIPKDGGPIYFKWDLEEVYILVPTDFPDVFGRVPPSCYITQPADPQRIVVLDGSNFKAETSGKMFLGWRVTGQTFHTRHYFVSYMGSVTEQAYDYWKQVNILANQVGSIFDAPPSPITGNIYNINNPQNAMLGYFQAVNESSSRFYLTGFDLPFQLNAYCEFNPDWAISRYPSECLNCINAANASYERPAWFGE